MLADAAARLAAAYIHIPFCAVRCPYCDFAVVEGQSEVDAYFSALITEVARGESWRPLDAVFFGGGTPSYVDVDLLRRVVEQLERQYGFAADCEISLEANPEDWSATLADELVEAGFTRVSFGAQSFDPNVLTRLGRRHRHEDSAAAVAIARRAGFDSISLDLIFGEPSETDESWAETLTQAIDTGVDHISTYALTVEPGTALHRAIARGAHAPDDDVQADRHEDGCRRLSAAGYVRYEVSNHAKPGHACRYNLIVWARGEYLGFGLGAHGFRNGRRTRNARNLSTYLERVESGRSPVVGQEVLSAAEAESERLFVGLRRAAGVRLDNAAQDFLETDEGLRLAEAGVVRVDGDRLRIVDPLLTDTVLRALIG